jgi:hypothetical protein
MCSSKSSESHPRQRARGYTVVNGELYMSGVTEPWLRCITSEKGVELLKKYIVDSVVHT